MILLESVICGPCRTDTDYTLEIYLPRPNMVVDPRPNERWRTMGKEFICAYHGDGKTVTLHRKGDHSPCDEDLFYKCRFRVYDPKLETIPHFHSTTYTYLGVDGECAPRETTLVLIHPSVKVIQSSAFEDCMVLKKCVMHDGVEIIEDDAFRHCSRLEVIRLSKNIKEIGKSAFKSCHLLKALFVPHSIQRIRAHAFSCCFDMSILSLPSGVDVSQIEREILDCTLFCGCVAIHPFIRKTQILKYAYVKHHPSIFLAINNDEVHQSLLAFYQSLPPLQQLCLSTNVEARNIHAAMQTDSPAATSMTDHNGMTPLHILSMNPYADSGSILACFLANMTAAFVKDSKQRTPLDYLRLFHDIDHHTSLVTALCMHRSMMAGCKRIMYRNKRRRIGM